MKVAYSPPQEFLLKSFQYVLYELFIDFTTNFLTTKLGVFTSYLPKQIEISYGPTSEPGWGFTQDNHLTKWSFYNV